MASVYVNLHPTYTYANVIISDGYIKELKEYVSLVDWLEWDWYSVKGKPLIQVSGGASNDDRAIEKHFERTWVLLQRIMSSGNHEIFIRDSKHEDWTTYQPNLKYTEKQMIEIEIQKVRESDKEMRLQADIEKYHKMLKYRGDELLKKMLQEAEENLKQIKKEEQFRKERIKGVWK